MRIDMSTRAPSPTRGKDEAPKAPGQPRRVSESDVRSSPINNTGRAPHRATLFLLASQGSSFGTPADLRNYRSIVYIQSFHILIFFFYLLYTLLKNIFIIHIFRNRGNLEFSCQRQRPLRFWKHYYSKGRIYFENKIWKEGRKFFKLYSFVKWFLKIDKD